MSSLGLNPGNLELHWDEQSQVYYLQSDMSIGPFARAFNFRLNREKDRYESVDVLALSNLKAYADQPTQARLSAHTHLLNVRFHNSTALSIPPTQDKLIDARCKSIAKPHQKAAALWLTNLKHALLADDMGVGKTLSAILAINLVCADNPTTDYQILIICPATLKLNWRNELQQHLTAPLSVGVAEGSKLPAAADILIINYDVLHRYIEIDPNKPPKAWNDKTFDIIIADEAHYAKNSTSRRGKALQKLMGKYKWALTGTPIINEYREVFSVLRWLKPRLYPSKTAFTTHYEGREHLLNKNIRSNVMMRRTYTEVAPELPLITRQVIEIPIESKKVQSLIIQEKEKFESSRGEIDRLSTALEQAKVAKDEGEFKKIITRMRVITNTSFNALATERRLLGIEKLPFIYRHIKTFTLESQKVVFFAHHKQVVESVYSHFNPEVVKLDGSMGQKQRQAAVERFQYDDKCLVFMGSIGAASAGITLTASRYVCFGELDWRPGVIHQAERRILRIGQIYPTISQFLVFEGSLDAYMLKKIIEKLTHIEKVIK